MCLKRIRIVFHCLLLIFIVFSIPQSFTQIPFQIHQTFQNPPTPFTQIPFWFWNDEITREGIHSQLVDFKAHGVHAFIPHARIGLSEKIGYLTPQWFDLIEYATVIAESLGMKMCLYDEGMYPSGSAHGEVVASNSELAAQGIKMLAQPVVGPQQFVWRLELSPNQKLIAVVVGQVVQQKMVRQSLRSLPVKEFPIVWKVPAGEWQIMLFIQTPTNGKIRGVFWGEDDGEANAPAAADLLNPIATQQFIRFTHERYYQRLARFFGSTIIGFFTDEPSLSGRRAEKGLKPWTNNFLNELEHHLKTPPAPVLPLLFLEADDGSHQTIRCLYEDAVQERLRRCYYQPLSEWCEQHQIALTGHPAEPTDMLAPHYFQIPGQDVVWRWVLPGKTALEGSQSTNAKTISSIARHKQQRWVLNECLGAYGWQLTPSEMKWLSDWLLVRGTNLLAPHAFYYSVAGPRRFERPPDVGPHNLWWQHYSLFSEYTNRISWLLTDSQFICECAIAAVRNQAYWRAASVLFRNQIDFNYLDEFTFEKLASIQTNELIVGPQQYRFLIIDQADWATSVFARKLITLLKNQIFILLPTEQRDHLPPNWQPFADYLIFYQTDQELASALASRLTAPIKMTPFAPDLRATHLVKENINCYFLTNEGNQVIEGTLALPTIGAAESWDAETGAIERQFYFRNENQSTVLPLKLEPRQSKIIAFLPDPSPLHVVKTNLSRISRLYSDSNEIRIVGWQDHSAQLDLTVQEQEKFYQSQQIDVSVPEPIQLESNWQLELPDGNQSELTKPIFWTEFASAKRFSGSLIYTCKFTFPDSSQLSADYCWQLKADSVREFAEVILNDVNLGVRLWPPFEWPVSQALKPGINLLKIIVTNTYANELTDESLPAGLSGEVVLIPEKKVSVQIPRVK